MMKKLKKLAAIAICALMLLQSAGAYAISFPDVTKDGTSGWAYDYIMELAEKGIITGYDDGTYKPQDDVKFLEVIKLLMGVMAPGYDEKKFAMEKFGAEVKNANVPDWAQESVAIARNRDIIKKDELQTAKNNGYLQNGAKLPATRQDVAIYMFRALELQKKVKYTLTYEDIDQIKENFRGEIAALIDTGILTAGGRDGKFAGESPIKRSEMAKMVKIAYDWVAGHPLKKGVSTEELKGVLKTAVKYNDNYLLAVDTGSGKNNFGLIVNDDTEVSDKNNKSVSKKDLEKYVGASLTADYKKLTSENVATKVKFTTDAKDDTSNMTVYSIDTRNSKITFDTIEKGIRRNPSYYYNNRTEFKKDGRTIYISSINNGDKVKNLQVDNNYIKELEVTTNATSGEYTFQGYEYKGGRYYILVRKNSGGSEYKYESRYDYAYTGSGSTTVSISSIPKYTQINLKFSNDVVTEIRYANNYSDAVYRVKRIWGNAQIEVENMKTGYSETINLPTYFTHRVNGHIYSNTLRNLREGDYINISYRDGKVDEITTTDYYYNGNYYTVVDHGNDWIELRDNHYGETKRYNLNTSGYYDRYNEWRRLSTLAKGDQVDVRFSGNTVTEIYMRDYRYSGSDKELVEYTLRGYSSSRRRYEEVEISDVRTGRLVNNYDLDDIRLYIRGNRVSSIDDIDRVPYTGRAEAEFDSLNRLISLNFDADIAKGGRKYSLKLIDIDYSSNYATLTFYYDYGSSYPRYLEYRTSSSVGFRENDTYNVWIDEDKSGHDYISYVEK